MPLWIGAILRSIQNRTRVNSQLHYDGQQASAQEMLRNDEVSIDLPAIRSERIGNEYDTVIPSSPHTFQETDDSRKLREASCLRGKSVTCGVVFGGDF